MTDYQRGCEKLFGLFDSGEPPDLRTDPAFAWRVLVAGKQNAFIWNALIAHPRFQGERLEDALYAAVCELGRNEK